MQEKSDAGEDIPAIENKPDLSDQPDLSKLFANFLMLSQTRQPGFSGPGTLRLDDILALYQADGWAEAGLEIMEYLRTMLFLDGVVQQYYKERKPAGR